MSKVHDIITEQILDAMSKGNIPWRKPWATQSLAPRNIKGNAYKGANVFLLSLLGHSDPTFLTYKQAQELGGNIKKGEKSVPVIFWKMLEEKQDDGTTKMIPMLRYFSVFHISQAEGIDYTPRTATTKAEPQAIDTAKAIVEGYKGAPRLGHGGDRAYYRPATDNIQVPNPADFATIRDYYSTLFHEMTHSTGHKDRLNRKEVAGSIHFGSESYSREELTAELGAAFLCAEAGISTDDLVTNSAAYIQSWSRFLKEDPQAFVSAAARAQRAVNHILGQE